MLIPHKTTVISVTGVKGLTQVRILGDAPVSYQLVGEVKAHQGYDG